MELDLFSWIQTVHGSSAVNDRVILKFADAAAQLLNMVMSGRYVIPLDCCRIRFDGDDDPSADNVFGEIVCDIGDRTGYTDEDGDIVPFGYKSEAETPSDEKGAVFTVGMILAAMLRGSRPEIEIWDKAKMNGPVMTGMNTALDTLLAAMTEADHDTRCGAADALGMLLKNFPSGADVSVVEKNTGAQIGTLNIPLTQPLTVWECSSENREFRGKKYFFKDKRLCFPYRACTVGYTAEVSFEKDDVVHSYDIGSGKCFIGIDAGESRTVISRLDNGRISGSETIPSSFEYFGSEVFLRDVLHNDGRTAVTGSDGSVHTLGREEAAEKFLGDVLKRYEVPGAVCALTCSRGYRELFGSSAEKRFRSYSPLKAAGTAFIYENDVKGKIFFIDAGQSSVRMCAAVHSGDNEIKWYPESVCDGGEAVTEKIFGILLQYVLNRYHINLYDIGGSGMTKEMFAADRKILRGAAEKLKCGALFSGGSRSAPVKAQLYLTGGRMSEISLDPKEIRVGSAADEAAKKFRSAVLGCLSMSHISPSETDAAVIAGRAAMLAEISDAAESVFGGSRIYDSAFDTALFARGAALCAALDDAGKSTDDEMLGFDIGIVSASSMNGFPVFTEIMDSGTLFADGRITIEQNVEFQADEAENGRLTLKLFMREAGKKHVLSTVGPEGGCIRFFGSVSAAVPRDYRFDTDSVTFTISIDRLRGISAEAVHMRRAGAGAKLKSLLGKESIRGGRILKGRITDLDIRRAAAK